MYIKSYFFIFYLSSILIKCAEIPGGPTINAKLVQLSETCENPIYIIKINETRTNYWGPCDNKKEILFIKVTIYYENEKKFYDVNLPLNIFMNKNGSFKEEGEKIIYILPNDNYPSILTIHKSFVDNIYSYYKKFINDQKVKKSNYCNACIIL